LEQLAYIRSGSIDEKRVQEEFHELVASYEFRKRFQPGYFGIFKSPALRKRLAYGIYATGLQQFGGIAAVTMYAAIIYESLGWNSGKQSLAINGIQSILQLFAVLVNTFTVDHFGRRTLLITGFSIQAIALLIMSSLTTSFSHNNDRGAAVVEVAMLFVVGLTYCWSNGPIAIIIASEIFPQHVRDKAFGLSLLGQTICLIALTEPWPMLNERIGGRSYWVLFSLNVVALVSFLLTFSAASDALDFGHLHSARDERYYT
jgi:MFS family permease